MSNHDSGFTAASVNATINDDFHTARQPVRIAWEPYGRSEHGDIDPQATHYRRIDGYVTQRGEYLHVECINGEEYIIAAGDVFAPSKEEWFGEDVVEKFDNPGEDLPATPLSDKQWVIGTLDGDTCTAIGINTVLLLPDNPDSRYGVCNVADLVSDAITDLESFDDHGREHALESVDTAFKTLRRARKALNDEYTKTLVTGIPIDPHPHSHPEDNDTITFTHPK